jgi:phospholipid/cholesterol/gamma-HCH transport system ATP-binding protein
MPTIDPESGFHARQPRSEGKDWSTEQVEAAAPIEAIPEGRQVLLRLRRVRKQFGARHILRGVGLNVLKGETLALIGGSGSGKTTLIRHLVGMLRADEGEVTAQWSDGAIDLNKATAADLDRHRLRLGMVFQNAALLNSLTVYENVALPLKEVDHLTDEVIHPRVIDSLRSVGLPAEEILRLKPAALSGGMRKRVGIARAVIRRPELMLYDEPTTGLDRVSVAGVDRLINDLKASHGVTSIIITHDLDEAMRVGDRIAMLFKGRIIFCGTPERFRQATHPAVKQLVNGSPYGPLTDALLQPKSDERTATSDESLS